MTTFYRKLLRIYKTTTVPKDAKEIEHRQQDRNKANVDQCRLPQPNFNVGSQVLVTTHVLSKTGKKVMAKFVPKRDGPYTIVKKIGSSTYQVAANDNLNMPIGDYHASALTLYRGTNSDDQPNPRYPIRRRGRPKKNTNAP